MDLVLKFIENPCLTQTLTHTRKDGAATGGESDAHDHNLSLSFSII